MSGSEDAEKSRRNHKAPYTQRHPIPTIAKYREEQESRQANALPTPDDAANLDQSKTESVKQTWQDFRNGEEHEGGHRNQDRQAGKDEFRVDGEEDGEEKNDQATTVDTSEITPPSHDPKQARKDLKKKKDNSAEREVTDPVTHLPVRISDFTSESLKNVSENPSPWGKTPQTATGLSNKRKSTTQLNAEKEEVDAGSDAMNALFPPPSYDRLREEMVVINKLGITVGLVGIASIVFLALAVERVLTPRRVTDSTVANLQPRWYTSYLIYFVLALASGTTIWSLIAGVRTWMANRMNDTWEEHIWEANIEAREQAAKAHESESVTWLNSLLGSVWPLINPDLFISLADTLEDVMQASLPRVVQMVSVDDVGQGSEALRILGVRWLPTGAAARSVGSDGKLQSKGEGDGKNDRSVPGEGEVEKNGSSDRESNSTDSNGEGDGSQRAEVAEGMEAEEGDFVNLEVSFAYRARKATTFRERTKDIHLYLAFYLMGGLKFPIWMDVKGLLGTCRLRLQLTPDPPFFSLCTITFLGQPKVDISCVPLTKRGLNIMDLPLVSNFVQSSVDAAMAEYVAPKSLTLDLKDMLAGDDFKKDTAARGVVVIDIIHGYDFKMGDASIPLISDGGSDPYVSVGWAKFGKPVFSTRVLLKAQEMEPYWRERCYLLVTPVELDVDERIRIQLWDSDRFTADDDLGRIEVDLKKIMRADETNGKMHHRTDGFRALEAGQSMPGKLEWRIGYFSKTRLQPCQFEQQTFDQDIRNMDQLNRKVEETCQKKLREAMTKKGRHARSNEELEQQKQQERKAMEDAMIISAPPPDGYPSGMFSIVVHQITGLELETPNKSTADKHSAHEDEEEEGESLPSGYCTVMINHRKVFKTRTKPKNAKPFYNAGTERFIGDWRNAEVHVSVRDARINENDPLIGIVHLPLGELFKTRSQVNGWYPLVGGVGYGRVRISMVWRSVQLQAPPENIGWDMGTVEIASTISTSDVPGDLRKEKVKWHSDLGRQKMFPDKEEQTWSTRKHRPIYLPVQKRYASCISLRIKRDGVLFRKDQTAAFAVLWLKDVPDDVEQDVTLPVYTGDYDRAVACALDEPGDQRVGSITVKLTFWSGLSGAHQKWASKDTDVGHVMEVLDTARDHRESRKNEKDVGIVDGEDDDDGDGDDDDDDSSSSSDSDDEDSSTAAAHSTTDSHADHRSHHGPPPVRWSSKSEPPDDDDENAPTKTTDRSGKREEDGGKMNLIDQAKEYKKHAKQKHRTQRGVMQYKLPRKARWAKDKVGRVESRISGLFSRHTKEAGIETES